MNTLTFDPSLYVVVPREPTKEMRQAMGMIDVRNCESFDDALRSQWLMAIEAAPPLPEQPQGEPQGFLGSNHDRIPNVAPAAGGDAPATDEETLCPHGERTTQFCRRCQQDKASSSIRAADSVEPVPAVEASVDLRNRALAYLALAEKATPPEWWTGNDVPNEGDRYLWCKPYIICHIGEADMNPNAENDRDFLAASHEAAAIIRELLNEAKL